MRMYLLPTPDDDHIIAASVGAEADCIVTGDKDLLDLRKALGIPIVAPRDFWKLSNSSDR